MHLVVRGRSDRGEDSAWVVIARLNALEVQDRQTAETGELTGQPGVHDGVHCRREDRNRQRDPGERLGQVDVGWLARVNAGGE